VTIASGKSGTGNERSNTLSRATGVTTAAAPRSPRRHDLPDHPEGRDGKMTVSS
jgi:hypothetical protein